MQLTLVRVLFLTALKLFFAVVTAPFWFTPMFIVKMLLVLLFVYKKASVFPQESALWTI